MKLFFNGQQDPNTAARSGTIGTNIHGLQFGDNFSGTEHRRFLDARLDELALYNTAMSEEQILTHYFAATQPSDERPRLGAAIENGQLQMSWPASATDVSLQSTLLLGPPAAWQEVTQPPAQQGDSMVVELPLPEDQLYFRLIR